MKCLNYKMNNYQIIIMLIWAQVLHSEFVDTFMLWECPFVCVWVYKSSKRSTWKLVDCNEIKCKHTERHSHAAKLFLSFTSGAKACCSSYFSLYISLSVAYS